MVEKKILQSKIRLLTLSVSKNLIEQSDIQNEFNTQNAKIASITKKTLVIGIDVGSLHTDRRLCGIQGNT